MAQNSLNTLICIAHVHTGNSTIQKSNKIPTSLYKYFVTAMCIKKYGCTAYVGIGKVQKGIWYVKVYWELDHNCSRVMQNAYRQKHFAIYSKSYSQSSTSLSQSRENWMWKFWFFYCYSFFFTQLEKYRLYTNILHIKQLLYSWRCSFSGLELYMSYEWQVTA